MTTLTRKKGVLDLCCTLYQSRSAHKETSIGYATGRRLLQADSGIWLKVTGMTGGSSDSKRQKNDFGRGIGNSKRTSELHSRGSTRSPKTCSKYNWASRDSEHSGETIRERRKPSTLDSGWHKCGSFRVRVDLIAGEPGDSGGTGFPSCASERGIGNKRRHDSLSFACPRQGGAKRCGSP